MKKLFFFFINIFLPKARKNFKNMATQGNVHLDALTAYESNPKVAALKAHYSEVYSIFRNLYDAWMGALGISVGGTKGFDEAFSEARAKLKEWDRQILGYYTENSVEYTCIFPKKRSFIFKGTQDQQLSKLRTFENEVKKYTNLSSIANEVAQYNQSLAHAYENKGVAHGGLPKASSELESAYVELGYALYEDMHSLCVVFSRTPEMVENFFDMALLRSAKVEYDASSQTMNIKAGKKSASRIKFAAGNTVLVKNLGSHMLYFYAAANAKTTAPLTLFKVEPSQELQLTAAQLGAPENSILIFVNSESSVSAKVHIELI